LKRLTVYLLSLIIYTTSFAQVSPLISNIQGRMIKSLNGDWQIIIDPYETGFYNYRYQESTTGFFLNQKPKDKTDMVEYDFDKSETLKVPGDWNSQKEKLELYEGTIWYKKDFDYTALTNGKRLFVHFGAVNYKAVVYLNGYKLGEHEGGFTPFNFEITGIVKEKGNFLVVKADNKRSREFVPTVNTDWWNYGGITRDVTLVEVPSTYITDHFVQLKKGTTDTIAGYVKLNGNSLQQKIKINIPGIISDYIVNTDNYGYGSFTIKGSPELWEPSNPSLYDVSIISGADTVSEKIGFRNIDVKGSDILLNGKKIFLKGISAHEEAPLRSGRAATREDAQTMLKWVKELNGNFIRLAHYPHNENVTRLADEMGILVWSEIPVYWTILWNNESTFTNAQNQLTDMIMRDKNRASVVLWSVANETPLSSERLSFLKRLIDRARSLDETRLITSALENHYVNDSTIVIDDPLGEYLDVTGLNEYLGWYDGLPDKADRINYEIKYNKPVVVSEFGADAKQGFYGDSLTRWSEEYQVSVYEHQVKLMRRFPQLAGMSPWILKDFKSPRRNLPGIQDHFNRKGLISETGIKKKAFNVLQEFYKEMPEAGY
jgi:beta-glucuronidase